MDVTGMSVNLEEKRNLGVLAALILGTIVTIAAGIMAMKAQDAIPITLIEEVAWAMLVLIAALIAYDKLLVM